VKKKLIMTPEEHQAEHIRLHRALDELMACYLNEGFACEDAGGKRGSIHDEIFSLMKWGYEKTLLPSSADRHDYRKPPVLIAQNDDPELLEWLAEAQLKGGDFISSLARAGLVADHENYPVLRFVLMAMRVKYPAYEPSDAVKQEIRERKP
jgi:hypothetical protein